MNRYAKSLLLPLCAGLWLSACSKNHREEPDPVWSPPIRSAPDTSAAPPVLAPGSDYQESKPSRGTEAQTVTSSSPPVLAPGSDYKAGASSEKPKSSRIKQPQPAPPAPVLAPGSDYKAEASPQPAEPGAPLYKGPSLSLGYPFQGCEPSLREFTVPKANKAREQAEALRDWFTRMNTIDPCDRAGIAELSDPVRRTEMTEHVSALYSYTKTSRCKARLRELLAQIRDWKHTFHKRCEP